MKFSYQPPQAVLGDHAHHATAAAGNAAVVEEAIGVLKDCVNGDSDITTILLKAAAGAGKSYALRRMVGELVTTTAVRHVGVTSFTNNQARALVQGLTAELGRERVGWLVGKDHFAKLEPDLLREVNASTSVANFSDEVAVVVGTSHRLGAPSELGRLRDAFGKEEFPFEVLLVDEAWQLPEHLFAKVAKHAPIVVGVGDVGQLPPLEIGKNPWRGDERYNPYRAWPHRRAELPTTWARELPTVWRPTAEQIGLWQAFYPDWDSLTSVAAPGDRALRTTHEVRRFAEVVDLVGTGVPVLLEVDGLPDGESADVDQPLTELAESLIEELVRAELQLERELYAGDGSLSGERDLQGLHDGGDPMIVFLATRNETVDNATEAVERLTEEYGLPAGAVAASTVDSWQGQTNGITVALHPLSGADQLDEFNSAFGRLAVVCTRATHGLVVLARSGLDDLLGSAAARSGTPFGEPGERQLPRQTHQRILRSFARARLVLEPGDLETSDREEHPEA
ncbi:AAA family ATPase [Parenemella sanctibonifatiensis]|uniref:AAA domain-containing protein n=1 Tax=Parenemella sanctibonifatiensis TaxID=2016505 RepID=A0A255EJ29_9ACTN|nr:AAA family ATPase [Parenemella sanctibonifatiensis]OYN91527.1 hypothetical protein CGZ92_00320 [Parenemella sanctibonifatiensis]